ncbi:MAG: GNAT family N-acetyltransferase [Arenimonas sp.]|nr:GNAT family N-acetyltransferase [Arenimonas sp.]MBP6309120.1 GNAT family N-acetyltransferase [Arenimonas sp.]
MTETTASQFIKDKLATLNQFPILESDCIRLRGIEENDIERLYTLFSNPQVMRYWSRGPMTNRQEAIDYANTIIEGFATRNVLNWIIADLESDQMIGTCTLYEINPQHARAGLGYALMPEYWGKGLAHDAASLAISYGFLELGLHRIEADTEPNNLRSNKVLERFGFQREGLLRERFFHPDGLQDSLIFGLLKPEWLSYLAKQGYSFEAD